MIVELKAEYPGFSLGEMATICYVRIGRRPGKHTIERVLSEEPVPLRMLRRFERYQGIPEPKEHRRAVVARSPTRFLCHVLQASALSYRGRPLGR
jgi:putative transposase